MKNLQDVKDTLVKWYKSFKKFQEDLDKRDNPGGVESSLVYSREEIATFNRLQNEYLGSIDGMKDFVYLSHAQILTQCLEIQNLIHFNLIGNTDNKMISELEDDYAFVYTLMGKLINYFTAK